MAVLSVREARGRSSQVSGKVDQLNSQRSWNIAVDSPLDNPFTIYNSPLVAAALPTIYSPHPSNLFYTCRGIRIEETDSPLFWRAIAEYACTPITREERERATYPNPVDRSLRINVDSAEFERYSLQDRNKLPMLNSAGDPYPAQVIEDSRTVIQLEKDVALWDAAWLTLNNSFNDSAVTFSDGVMTHLVPAECGYLKRVRISQRREENDFQFYVVSCELHYKEDPEDWRLHLLDEGFHYLADGEKQRILLEDDEGNKTIEPASEQLLNGLGQVLDKGDEPIFNDFDLQKVKSWSGLPFFS